jgi:phenylpropionate dioxygenase-like ring-hydroxylating dioxygenase large terminal subunit
MNVEHKVPGAAVAKEPGLTGDTLPRSVPKDHYVSHGIFEEEVRRIFSRGFQFVALSTDLLHNRDFVCLDYHGVSVVVQNFKGEIKAFQNVCTHRFNKIQNEQRGNRPLSCTYHGWSFDAQGCPMGIAKSSDYLGSNVEQADICLPKYEVEICGKFVFVKLDGSEEGLHDYLGSFYEVLEALSPHIGGEVLHETLTHCANWKLLTENVIDIEHCPVAHKESFVPQGYCQKPIEELVFDGPHSSNHIPRQALGREGARNIFLSHLKSRGYTHDSYYHIHLFPNLFVASSEGIAFYVGQVLPIGPEETQLRVRYFEPAVELSPKHRKRQDQLNDDTNANGLKILGEDRDILENIQKGMKMSPRPGVIAEGEKRIRNFFDHYFRLMSA